MRWVPWLSCLLAVSACALGTPTEPALRFQTTVEQLRTELGLPGMTAAYVFDTGRRGSAAAGWADKETRKPMRDDSRMLAASIGKSVVAATAVSLVMEGTLQLDRPVSHWLGHYPWFPRVPNHATITLRHLLTHTSGVPDYVYMPAFAEALSRSWQSPRNLFPPERLIGFVLDQPALFAAGEGWAYSDTGYILAGLVIEAATGRHYFELAEHRFIIPLSLSDTAPADSRNLIRLAAGYTPADNRFGLPGKTLDAEGHLQWHPALEWTGGGLVSASPDLARWGSLLFTGRAMPGNYLHLMLETVPTSDSVDGARYGLGVAVTHHEQLGPVYGHAGWIPGYVSSLRYYPEVGVSVAFQINTDVGIIDHPAVLNKIEARLIDTLLDGPTGKFN